ncbi:hypothetical protein CRYUN_Cryun22dG0092800 [Craigia yunnanensis]
MILVYEFMEKGTLRDHLYYSTANLEKSYSARSELSWKQRLEICIGAAKGLNYLHTGSAGGIIHRDVKSTNILLDEQFVAKVADFGLSKSGLPDVEHSVDVKGTFGYLDPEYFISLQLTDKSDVYSFGVVLLEVLCARPAVVTSNRREEVNLAEWGLLWLEKGQLEKIIDPMLVDTINPNSLRKFAETTEKCLKPSGSERPIMRDVLWDLEYALQLQITPMNRGPLEDSTTNASLEFSMPVIHRFPSNSFPGVDEEDATVVFEDASDVTANEVFSILRIGFMNISIGPDGSSFEPKTTFVNGIEIMEMMGESDLVPITNKYYQNSVFIIVDSVLGGLVLVCILGDLVFIGLRRRKQKPVETSDWSPLIVFKGSTHGNWQMPQLSTLSTEGTITTSPSLI